MEVQLIKTLLNKDTYQSTKPKLRKSIFSEDAAVIYDILKETHAKYDTDLKPDDLYSIWISENPVATTAEINDFRDTIDELKNSDFITPEIAGDVIENLWRREIGRDIANLGLNMSA